MDSRSIWYWTVLPGYPGISFGNFNGKVKEYKNTKRNKKQTFIFSPPLSYILNSKIWELHLRARWAFSLAVSSVLDKEKNPGHVMTLAIGFKEKKRKMGFIWFFSVHASRYQKHAGIMDRKINQEWQMNLSGKSPWLCISGPQWLAVVESSTGLRNHNTFILYSIFS